MQVSNEDLIQAYNDCKDSHVEKRLHAMCLMQIRGYDIKETADLVF